MTRPFDANGWRTIIVFISDAAHAITVDLRLKERDTLTYRRWTRAQTTLPLNFVGFDLIFVGFDSIIRILVLHEGRLTSYVFIRFYASSKKAVYTALFGLKPDSFLSTSKK